MFVGAFIYAQLVGNICGIFADMDPHVSDYHKTMDTLNDYMDELKKSDEMDRNRLAEFKIKLRRYFNQSKALHKDKYYKDVLKMMSPGLQGEFSALLYKESFEAVYFFRPPKECDVNKRTLFISAVACKLQSASYPGLERIIFIGEQTCEPTSKMYIIRKGIIGCGGRLRRFGHCIGEDIILKHGTRRYMATTLSFVDTLTLTSRDLYDVLESSDDFKAQRKVVRRAAVRLAFRDTIRQVVRRIRAYKLTICRNKEERRKISININVEMLWNNKGVFAFDDPNKRLVTMETRDGRTVGLEQNDSNVQEAKEDADASDPIKAFAAVEVEDLSPMDALLFIQKWSKHCQTLVQGPASRTDTD